MSQDPPRLIGDRRAFILANTRLQPVPHAPEISLWLAEQVTPIWRLTEDCDRLMISPAWVKLPASATA